MRWKDVIVLDFSQDKLQEQNTLTIETLYRAPYCPEHRLVTCITVFEEDVIDDRGRWRTRASQRPKRDD